MATIAKNPTVVKLKTPGMVTDTFLKNELFLFGSKDYDGSIKTSKKYSESMKVKITKRGRK